MTTDYWWSSGECWSVGDVRLADERRPCSVHDPEQALTYCKELLKYAEQAEDDLLIVMRVYFEK